VAGLPEGAVCRICGRQATGYAQDLEQELPGPGDMWMRWRIRGQSYHVCEKHGNRRYYIDGRVEHAN
jgi:hypothetical protein